MILLFKAALKSSRHFLFALFALFSLCLLTVSNSLEMCSLGLLTNTGTDFFALFGNKKKPSSKINLQRIKNRWDRIDKNNKGYISRKDAALYISHSKQKNPLNLLLHKFKSRLDIEENFINLIVLLVSVAIFKAFWLFTARYATQVLSIKISRDLRQNYFEHIQFLPMSFYNDHDMGSLTSRAMGDAGQIAASLNSCFINYLQTPFAIFVSFLGCFYISWQLSLVIFFGLPMIIIPIVFLTRQIKKVARQIQKNQESFTSVLLDFVSGIRTVKIFSMEQFTRKKYKEKNDEMALLEAKSAKYALLTRPVLHAITTACVASVVIFGLYTLRMSLSELLVFIGFLYLFYEPVKKFAEENSNMQKGLVAAERMFEVLNLKSYSHDEGKEPLTDIKRKIEFQNVSFKYRNSDWVLRRLSFEIEKGQTVAIVGPTGAGKSTIVQLLPRLFDPQEGVIKIDGRPIQDYTLKSLRDNISFVPQNPFLFFDTIAENISFGRNFLRDEIEMAAKKAQAHDFIMELPKGYDSVIQESSKNISGGQQQRLAIARALIKNAPVLIMDEATSALDAISESRIKVTSKELHGKITQIIIAHRLSTIEHADKIIYLEKGEKIAEGTKEALLECCLPFRQMWNSFHAGHAL